MAIPDPDVIRWGLHHLLDVCSPGNFGSPYTITGYDKDMSEVAYVREDYCHNDEMLARAYQEELSRVASAQSVGSSSYEDHPQQVSVLAQDWNNSSDYQSAQYGAGYPEQHKAYPNLEGTPVMVGYESGSPEIEDDSMLDGEVGRRLNQMCPIAHVPKINGEMPTVDEATSDHQRLLDRLQLYDLVELKVSGDGNCQFRSLSDQIYRTTEHHKFVREQIIHQLQSHRELYEGYVPMAYDEYMKKMSRNGEWGDHVTLQAAADSYGVRILVITSFKDTCYIEILPQDQKSNRIITLSFWAEVHYNSIYPPGEFPELETKKKKKWWWPVI